MHIRKNVQVTSVLYWSCSQVWEGFQFHTPQNVQVTSGLKPFSLNGVLLVFNVRWDFGKNEYFPPKKVQVTSVLYWSCSQLWEGFQFHTPQNVQVTSGLKPFIINGVLLVFNVHWDLWKN